VELPTGAYIVLLKSNSSRLTQKIVIE